ncbi:MAG TPA: TldD/PmbA family protein [Candidatus Bathyarchaeia archaeon]|jgi:TldD protein|nr:TldD/PmbA family protein [Candidatus Bathyarchaeia archaeon]
MEEDIVDFALKYAEDKKVEYAEVRAQSQQRDQLILRSGILEAFTSAVDDGFCVRILANGGIGFASTNKWSKEEAKRMVDLAFKYAKAAGRKDKIVFAKEKGVETKWTVEQKKKMENISPEEKISTFVDIDKALASCGVKMPATMSQCTIDLITKYFVNSEGSKISSFVPKIAGFFFITVAEQGKTEQAYKQFGYSGGWEAFDEWKATERIIHDAKVLRDVITKGQAVKPGNMDLVCGPDVTGIAAHESCGHPMEADRILGREMSQAGRSFIFKGGQYWIGTKIGSDVVTVVDDPTVEHSYGYYAYDDEGLKARRRHLYKNGVINEFLQNRESAAKLDTKSNASSRSVNYDREAIVRMANTFVLPGNLTEEELIEDVKYGVFMKSFTEWNIDDKRFNQRYVGREAYLIENGELKHPIARPVIETTTPKFWTAVDAVSKKVEFEAATCGKGDPGQGIPVFTGGPCIRLRGVYVK